MSIKIMLALGLVMTCCLIVTLAQIPGGKVPPARVSNEQLEIALKDKRYLSRQLKCILGQAPCDPVGRRIKTMTPSILRGSCPKCSPTEEDQIKRVLAHIQLTFPKEWSQVFKKFGVA